jgi:hypothetical protein
LLDVPVTKHTAIIRIRSDKKSEDTATLDQQQSFGKENNPVPLLKLPVKSISQQQEPHSLAELNSINAGL